jgi:hypothetical protein
METAPTMPTSTTPPETMLRPSVHAIFRRCEDFEEEDWGRGARGGGATVGRRPTPGRRGAKGPAGDFYHCEFVVLPFQILHP